MMDGMKIAYQQWGAGNKKQVLMLHGWLDNSNTFNHLGPYLADKGFNCVAIDHIGHGRSSHLPPSGNYTSIKAVSYVKEVIENLEMGKCHLLGHSMGANISFVYAGCFSETIDRLVMIDGLGPPTFPGNVTAKNLRKAVENAEKVARKTSLPKLYKTFKDAVDARVHSVTTYPGEQTLSREAAVQLVGRYSCLQIEFMCYLLVCLACNRGTYLAHHANAFLTPYTIAHESSEAESDVSETETSAVRFRHDPRLVLPTFQYHTPEQVKM